MYYFVESIHRKNDSKAFISTECDSYENFVNGNCVENSQVPMGETLLASM